MSGKTTTTALGQFKVLDLTRIRSGPTCVRVLADFGADVIRIESPAGLDPNEGALGGRDTYDMLNLHRNKRSLTLNLKSQEGRDIFHQLVRQQKISDLEFKKPRRSRHFSSTGAQCGCRGGELSTRCQGEIGS